MNVPRPALKLPNGLLLVAEVETHGEILLLANAVGIKLPTIESVGWLDCGLWQKAAHWHLHQPEPHVRD